MSGKPREARHIVDDVCELFKAWEDGKKSNKLNFMFESKESSELCKRFITIFKLKELPNYKDVSSLTDARWAVLEYSNRKKYPLWALKYAGCSEALQQLIDNIVKICDPNGLANQELIGTTAKAIKNLELDLSLLLVEPDAFKKGFLAFLKQDEKVNLKDHELDSVYEYLVRHLQGEIGRWTENEVKLQELYWRMEQQSGGEGGQGVEGELGGQGGQGVQGIQGEGGQGSGGFGADEAQKRKDSAKNVVTNADSDLMRKALMELVEKGNNEVIDILLSYVQ